MGDAVLALKAAAADNLMVAIFGPMIVLLLAYALYTTNDRFGEVNDRFGEVNDRFIALEASIDRRFAAQDDKIDALDAKIDALDAKFDEMNLKLTALIAALDKTDEVDAALAGRDRPAVGRILFRCRRSEQSIVTLAGLCPRAAVELSRRARKHIRNRRFISVIASNQTLEFYQSSYSFGRARIDRNSEYQKVTRCLLSSY